MASGKTLTKGKSGLRMIPTDINDRSPFTIDEPPWQPDEKVNDELQDYIPVISVVSKAMIVVVYQHR